ncbi:hypothetical protein PSECIP111951_02920 [Pseudoalteromonas holothuriae]|nr:DUF3325 domain-containing protein [Pseudoalteromonas sp. CIP111951]CAH9063522.1 hypothetical protein PSECIP111951_02920 [Pseudoalteromonas sp. CIP111951]
MIMLFSVMFIYQALCLFLLSLPKYTKVLGREFKPSEIQARRRRVAAWGLIAISWYLSSLVMGWVNAVVFILGLLTVGGCCLSVLFQYRPQLALRPVLLHVNKLT